MKLLADIRRAGRRVRVYERHRDGSRCYFDGWALHTQVDAGGDNLLLYVDAMAKALQGSANVLILGTAGGALATKLRRGGARVCAVDDWPTAFHIARRWFSMPADVECVDADALAFLNATERRWPAVALDVFARGRIPKKLLSAEFGSALAKAVEPAGLVVWNIDDCARSSKVRKVEAILQQQGFDVWRIPVLSDDVGNTLVVGRGLPNLLSGAVSSRVHEPRAEAGGFAALPPGDDLGAEWLERANDIFQMVYSWAHIVFANLHPLDRWQA